MEVRRRHHSPLVGTRPQIAAPADERSRVAERAGAAEHEDKDGHVQCDQARRHECPWSACAEGLAECLALWTPLGCGLPQFPQGGYHGLKEPCPFFGAHDVQAKAAEDEDENQNHHGCAISSTVKTCASRQGTIHG